MRKQKVNKYEHFTTPTKTLDFHHLGPITPQDVEAHYQQFITSCVKEGTRRALIITGKGLHSEDGEAKVRPHIERLLQKDHHVRSFTFARRDRGGQGAFELQL